jgi:AraC-like DNA-binding protein
MAETTQSIDSELGVWTFTEWRPDPGHPLEWVVEHIWDFHGRTALARERVFPNGGVELIIQMDGRHHDVHAHGLVITPATCITGIHTKAFVVEAPARPGRVLGIRFHPPGAWALLQHPLIELSDLTTDVKELLGSAISELAEACEEAPTSSARVRSVVAWLLDRFRSQELMNIDPAVRWMASSIVRAGGNTPIAMLRGKTGMSDARLTSAFRQQVGVTPKHFARIHRFRRALALLNQRSHRLAELAVSAGYYDQPHMNLEFREMAGMTPGEYLAAQRYPNSTSLPESAD